MIVKKEVVGTAFLLLLLGKKVDQEVRPKKSPEDLNIRKKTHLKEIISQEKPEKGVEENEVMSKTLKGLVTNVPEGF